jgi:hypothetical protein
MEELAKTDEGRVRLGLAEDRMMRSVAEHVEQHDDRKALAQGEIDDVPDVPLRDPFQNFEPLHMEETVAESSLPSSSHEPTVAQPVDAHAGSTIDTHEQPANPEGGMDIDIVETHGDVAEPVLVGAGGTGADRAMKGDSGRFEQCQAKLRGGRSRAVRFDHGAAGGQCHGGD